VSPAHPVKNGSIGQSTRCVRWRCDRVDSRIAAHQIAPSFIALAGEPHLASPSDEGGRKGAWVELHLEWLKQPQMRENCITKKQEVLAKIVLGEN
jgi:hypothetical protein